MATVFQKKFLWCGSALNARGEEKVAANFSACGFGAPLSLEGFSCALDD